MEAQHRCLGAVRAKSDTHRTAEQQASPHISLPPATPCSFPPPTRAHRLSHPVAPSTHPRRHPSSAAPLTPKQRTYPRSPLAQAETLKEAGASEVVVEYDELPRAALELLSGGPGPARLKRFTDLSTYYRTVSGPASTAGMTVDELRIVAGEVRSYNEYSFCTRLQSARYSPCQRATALMPPLQPRAHAPRFSPSRRDTVAARRTARPLGDRSSRQKCPQPGCGQLAAASTPTARALPPTCRCPHHAQVAMAAGLSPADGAPLLELYLATDADGSGTVSRSEMRDLITRTGVRTDSEMRMLSAWLDGLLYVEGAVPPSQAQADDGVEWGSTRGGVTGVGQARPVTDGQMEFDAFCRVVRAVRERYPDSLASWGLTDPPPR